jgi:hypothetical protein
MTVVARFEVLPLYGQIDIRDPAATEYPQWETGEERVVSNTQCIAVATRGDADGPVSVEVRIGPIGAPRNATRVFDGEVLLTGDEIVIGDYLASEVHPVSLGPGWHPVTVWTRPPENRPDTVIVVLDAEPPS